MLALYICIPRSFLVIKVGNQRKTLCSPCISVNNKLEFVRRITVDRYCFAYYVPYIYVGSHSCGDQQLFVLLYLNCCS